jgi:hypothetical protein
LILNVPLKVVESAKFPVKLTTCPSMAAEVRDVLPAVAVPVKAIVVNRSKQLEPSTWSAPLTALPAVPILPENIRGGFPGTVDDAVNCQLPDTVGVWAAVGVVGVDDAILSGASAPAHPQKRIVTARARMISNRAMDSPLSPEIVQKVRQTCHKAVPSPQGGLQRNLPIMRAGIGPVLAARRCILPSMRIPKNLAGATNCTAFASLTRAREGR